MEKDKVRNLLDETFAKSGLRMTRQRKLVYEVLMAKRDHPTAEEVFRRVKERTSNISLATVYNCLEKLVECGLIRQVNRDRESSRFCGNLSEHGHFHCNQCGSVYDIDLTRSTLDQLVSKPSSEFQIEQFDITFRGLCPDCQPTKTSKPNDRPQTSFTYEPTQH